MYAAKFCFGSGNKQKGSVAVTADARYDGAYGFVTEECRRSREELRIPELNAGFDTVYWFQQENLTNICEEETSCYIEKENPFTENQRRIPLCFKIAVPRQGNYRMQVTMCPGEDTEDILLFVGRRRLAYKVERLAAHESLTVEAMVNVCDIVPRGKTRIYEDTTIDLAIVADRPCISAVCVEEVKCPTIYIAGDSTVTDQSADYPYAPGTSYSGWGQMLGAYLKTKISVSNHSHSGLTTDSFRKEGHYAVIEQYIKENDYMLFQFGHNDQKLDELKAAEGYRNNLKIYIKECRRNGAFPLLVTPVARNSWRGDDGSYNDLLSEYARVCRELGEEMDIPVLELHERSMEFVKALGLENAKRYFYPGDFTHSNDYGAYRMAAFVSEEIVRNCKEHKDAAYRQLADYVTEGIGEWQPPQEILLPVKPEGYENMINPDAVELFADLEEPERELSRAEALDMVIKTARFFPTNVYNDMFDDVVGHEWYAGTVECACQNGIIPPQLCQNRHFYPEKGVQLKEFLAFLMNGYRSRRSLPEEKECCYDTKVEDYLLPYVRAACTLGVIEGDGTEEMERVISRGSAAKICRALGL